MALYPDENTYQKQLRKVCFLLVFSSSLLVHPRGVLPYPLSQRAHTGPAYLMTSSLRIAIMRVCCSLLSSLPLCTSATVTRDCRIRTSVECSIVSCPESRLGCNAVVAATNCSSWTWLTVCQKILTAKVELRTQTNGPRRIRRRMNRAAAAKLLIHRRALFI